MVLNKRHRTGKEKKQKTVGACLPASQEPDRTEPETVSRVDLVNQILVEEILAPPPTFCRAYTRNEESAAAPPLHVRWLVAVRAGIDNNSEASATAAAAATAATDRRHTRNTPHTPHTWKAPTATVAMYMRK